MVQIQIHMTKQLYEHWIQSTNQIREWKGNQTVQFLLLDCTDKQKKIP